MKPGDNARAREGEEPHEAPRSVPFAMALLVMSVGVWGAWYFSNFAGLGGEDLGDARTPAVLMPAVQAAGEGPDGGAIYTARCVACHQGTGLGLSGAFPPLAGSEWVVGAPERPIAIALYGFQGAITVAGTDYASAMPAQALTDDEAAAVLSYVRESWDNQAQAISPEQVAAVREALGERGPMDGQSELEALYP